MASLTLKIPYPLNRDSYKVTVSNNDTPIKTVDLSSKKTLLYKQSDISCS